MAQDPGFDRYEANFTRSFERAQAQYENQTPEYEDDAETEDDLKGLDNEEED
jgi:hypothetical protein